jgi:Bifunctional DNA primase/polymerase, N-terminal
MEALDLATQGWAVFPCHPRDIGEEVKAKAPLTAHGFHDATTNLDQIRRWWRRWPDAMIGARVPDQFIVVDVDPRNGGNLGELAYLAGERLDGTLTVWSGRGDGGHHLYYQRPAGELTRARLPKGIDLKIKGYCIVPPSVHPVSGQPYRWDHQAVSPMPLGLKDLLRPEPQQARAWPVERKQKSGQHLVDFVAKFVTDGVNDALYWAALRAAEKGLLDEIRADLIATAVSVGESQRRAEKTVDSARRAWGAA